MREGGWGWWGVGGGGRMRVVEEGERKDGEGGRGGGGGGGGGDVGRESRMCASAPVRVVSSCVPQNHTRLCPPGSVFKTETKTLGLSQCWVRLVRLVNH